MNDDLEELLDSSSETLCFTDMDAGPCTMPVEGRAAPSGHAPTAAAITLISLPESEEEEEPLDHEAYMAQFTEIHLGNPNVEAIIMQASTSSGASSSCGRRSSNSGSCSQRAELDHHTHHHDKGVPPHPHIDFVIPPCAAAVMPLAGQHEEEGESAPVKDTPAPKTTMNPTKTSLRSRTPIPKKGATPRSSHVLPVDAQREEEMLMRMIQETAQSAADRANTSLFSRMDLDAVPPSEYR